MYLCLLSDRKKHFFINDGHYPPSRLIEGIGSIALPTAKRKEALENPQSGAQSPMPNLAKFSVF
jgi:hypothetical protein